MTCARCDIPDSLTVEKILFIVEVDGESRSYCGRCKRLHVDPRLHDPKATAKHRWGWIDTAFERVPAPMRASLYKSLSRVLHPDVGGDPEAMRMLNAAHERHEELTS